MYRLYAHTTNSVCRQLTAKRLSQEHINIPGQLKIPHIFVDPEQHPGITQEFASNLRSEDTLVFCVPLFLVLLPK